MTIRYGELPLTPYPKPMDEPKFKIVEEFQGEHDRLAPTRKQRASFNPPLNLDSYVPIAHFSSKLLLSKGL